MLHKTRGIVFRFTKYGDSSIIVNIFTELFGLQSYIVNGVRSSSGKNRIALFQPLTLLDLVVYHKENASIMRIKEVKCLYPYHSIPTDIKKSSIAFFLNEVINKCVKEQAHAHGLCEFLINSFIELDRINENVENFHLHFLINLSQHLGFRPYHASEVRGAEILSSEDEKILTRFLSADPTLTTLTLAQRRTFLDILLRFYSSHVEQFGEIRSLAVVRELIY